MTKKQVIAILPLLLVLSSCAGTKSSVKPSGGLFGTKSEGGVLDTNARSVKQEQSFEGNEVPDEILGYKITNKTFDMPVVVNSRVENQIRYFTGAARKYFQIYLERMSHLEPMITSKLEKAGLPKDLIYLAMIESGFSTQAYSRAGAAGPWQFIRSTGKTFDLDNSWWIDERRDPIKSTDSAIEYLGQLYKEFGDWPLACASYNAGEQKIRNVIAKLNTRDYWEIVDHRRALKRETKDYVPRMMAAAIIAKNAEAFGFQRVDSNGDLWANSVTVEIKKPENLRTIANVAGIDLQDIRELNPELIRCCTPPKTDSYLLRLPHAQAQKKVLEAIDAGELGQFKNFHRHVISRGDSISRIATKYGTSKEAIVSMNEVSSVSRLKPGTELLVPEKFYGEPREGRHLASRSSRKHHHSRDNLVPDLSKDDVKAGATFHLVQKGDTLYDISRRYAVRVDQIRRWNALARAKNLRPGSRIKLYVRNENSKNI